MIVSGYKVTGKRQIQGFHIAGDIPDLQSLPLRVLDNSVGTITQAEFGDALGLPAVHVNRVLQAMRADGIIEQPRLLAVLVRLSDNNDVAPGPWFVEAGFGRRDGRSHPTFADLEAAQDWISRLVRSGPRSTE